MKLNRLLVAALCSLPGLYCHADNQKVMTVKTGTGSTAFALTSIGSIKYSDDAMIVTPRGVAPQHFDLSTLEGVYFNTGSTSVIRLDAEARPVMALTRRGNTLHLSGKFEGLVTLYDASGRIVDAQEATDEADLNLKAAGTGLYLIQVNGETFKIMF